MFGATAVTPFIRIDSRGIAYGLADYERFHGKTFQTGDEIASLSRAAPGDDSPPKAAKQVMLHLLVCLTKAHLPPYAIRIAPQSGETSDRVEDDLSTAVTMAATAGIRIVGPCCDGDSPPRKVAMRKHVVRSPVCDAAMGLQRPKQFLTVCGIFEPDGRVSIFYPNVTHMPKKSRNALLNVVTKTLVVGNYSITLSHVDELLEKYPLCGIPKAALKVPDKQNVRAALALISEDVPSLLLIHVGDKARGTALYLAAWGNYHRAYSHPSLDIRTRLKGVLYNAFFSMTGSRGSSYLLPRMWQEELHLRSTIC